MLPPYIGVTGFMTRAEVSAAVTAYDRCRRVWNGRKLMVGVLASRKTLAGQPNKWPNRYPELDDIASLLPPHPHTVNLIHYATDERSTLAAQLREISRIVEPNLDGFQLNIRWPDPTTIVLRWRPRLVLQLGHGALQDADNDPETVAKRLDAYKDIITDVLVDTSGGHGVLIDPVVAEAYVLAIGARHPWLGVGLAGGLSAQAVEQLRPLLGRHRDVSLDAEGRLRTEDDRLDAEKMKAYVVAADRLFG